MAGPALFCARCGAAIVSGNSFCTRCGTRVAGDASSLGSAYGAVASIAGMTGMGLALPWRTVYEAEDPDIRGLLSAAALPAARQAVRASLRRPGIAMAVTATLDLAVTIVTGGIGAVASTLPRFLLGGSTAVLSLLTGRKGGALRMATGVASLVTIAVQLGFAGFALSSGLVEGDSLLLVVPGVVAMLSSLVMAVKTAVVALRR